MEDNKNNEKRNDFQNKLEALCESEGADLYAANVMMPNGEVVPMIKMRIKEDELMVGSDKPTQKEDADKT